MSKNFTVVYNAIRAEHGSHLIAVGWCNEAGWMAILESEGATSNFRLSFKKMGGDASAQVITPFVVTAEIADSPRSVHVEDDHGRHQVQVNGVAVAGSGENTAGKWVLSE